MKTAQSSGDAHRFQDPEIQRTLTAIDEAAAFAAAMYLEDRLAALERQVAELTRRLNDVTVSKYAPVYTLNTRRNA